MDTHKQQVSKHVSGRTLTLDWAVEVVFENPQTNKTWILYNVFGFFLADAGLWFLPTLLAKDPLFAAG